MPSTTDATDVLRGEVISWRLQPKPDTGWHIVVIRDMDGAEQTVTGCSLPRPGAAVELRGEWQEHARFGRQFHARSVLKSRPPLSADGVARWLTEHAPGIGPARAAKLLEHFRGDAGELWRVLEHEPGKLANVAGMNPELARLASEALQTQGADSEYQALLHGWGMTQRQIVKVKSHWTLNEAARLLHDNPYLLADHIDGFGFKRADDVAKRAGIAHNAPVRINAGLLHFIGLAAGAGHVFADETVVKQIARDMRVPVERLLDGVKALRTARRLVVDSGARLYLPWLYEAECAVAADLRMRFAKAPSSSTDATGDVETVVVDTATARRDEWQMQAVARLVDMSLPIVFVTGGPGTGKTTVLEAALNQLEASGVQVALAAPTGKAAKRMSQATGQRAYTLHTLLGYRPTSGQVDCEHCRDESSEFDYSALSQEQRVVIVDESSMVDVQLWAALVHAAAGGMRLCFVGDANQLPPVGPGQPFRDALDFAPSSVTTRLRTVYRSKGEWVKLAAPMILAGRVPPLDDAPGLHRVSVECADEVVPALTRLVSGELNGPHFSFEAAAELGHVPILSPQRTGPAGVNAINRALHELFNPRDESGDVEAVELEDDTELRVGSWVMLGKNNARKRVCNGDTGYVTHVARGGVTIAVEGLDSEVQYSRGEAREQVRLAYASTVHKSQGSEYPWVAVVCHSTHRRMLTRRLLYTAVTRAKEGVVLLGDTDGIEHAIGNAREVSRCTWLPQRLGAKS